MARRRCAPHNHLRSAKRGQRTLETQQPSRRKFLGHYLVMGKKLSSSQSCRSSVAVRTFFDPPRAHRRIRPVDSLHTVRAGCTEKRGSAEGSGTRTERVRCAHRFDSFIAVEMLDVLWDIEELSVDLLEDTAVYIASWRDRRETSQERYGAFEEPLEALRGH